MIFYTTEPTVVPTKSDDAKPCDTKPSDCRDAIYRSIIGMLVFFNFLQLFYIILTRRKLTG